MPTGAVWIIITVPKKSYEKEKLKATNKNLFNALNGDADLLKNEKDVPLPLEKVLEDCLEELGVEDVVWVPTKNDNFYHVYFPCDLIENDPTLQFLQSKGFGVKPDTSIGYIPFGLFFCDEEFIEDRYDENFNKKSYTVNKELTAFKESTQKFLKSVTSRLTVAQVVDGVRSSAELTFDFVCYTFFGGWIGAMGLLNNSPVDIAASMMIEPIMATVMAMTFGAVIEDKSLIWTGIKSCIVALLECILVGFIIGMIVFIWPTGWEPPTGVWPTPEMASRGQPRILWYGANMAVASGGAIAVSLLNNNAAAFVGVAVASTFLPPFINTGLLWAMSVHIQIRGNYQAAVPMNFSGEIVYMRPAWVPMNGYTPYYSNDMRVESALLGCVSMALTGINVIGMFLCAYLLLRIKEVSPLAKLSPKYERFFRDDIRITREYNRRKSKNKDSIGNQILKEWATITGLDKNQLLSNKPEAKITQIQTLYDIAQDVEADEVYQSIVKTAIGGPNQENLIRRLTQPIIVHREETGGYTNNIPIWDFENEVLETTHSGRRHTISPLRRSSRWNNQLNFPFKPKENISRFQVVDTISGNRVTEDTEGRSLDEEKDDRRSSILLQRSLRESEHLPYSIWPSSSATQTHQANTSHLHSSLPSSANSSVRKRSHPFKLPTHQE